VIPTPEEARTLWRVGYYADPLGFTPLELYQFSHRFDDIRRRFRTLYCAESPETCLREVLADFRPNLAALRRHVERYGPEAAEDFTAAPVTARWRAQHVLVPVVLRLEGPLIDLTDLPTRREIEERHIELLVEYGMDHLDLHEITTSRRVITQTIAADLFDRGASAVRFPSRLDGQACVAVFEKRGTVEAAGDPIALTDPPPEPLTKVTAPWGLALEPAPTAGPDHNDAG
jgi:RES domain